MHISSVSTTENAKITLYIIAESTVTSSNLPTATLNFEKHLSRETDPESYVEGCIQKAVASEGGGLVVMWSGVLYQYQLKILDGLMETPFQEGKKNYLTRLETRMGPESMTEDIRFVLDPSPKTFQCNLYQSTITSWIAITVSIIGVGIVAVAFALSLLRAH